MATTAEDPMLAVVRFTAELASAWRRSSTSSPAAGSTWRPSCSHPPTSSSSLPAFRTKISSASWPSSVGGSEDEALQIAEITQQPDDKPAPRLRVRALQLATAGKAADCIIPALKNIDSFVADWAIGDLEQRELFLAIARILKDHKGMSREYFNFLNKYLATFKGAGDEADAKEEAVTAIIEFVKSPHLCQCDLLNMPAVGQLEKDEKYQPVYELLKIFRTQRLDSYLEFQTANSTMLKGYGLVHDECITKMRLMSLLDLSSHCSGEIPYSAITDTL